MSAGGPNLAMVFSLPFNWSHMIDTMSKQRIMPSSLINVSAYTPSALVSMCTLSDSLAAYPDLSIDLIPGRQMLPYVVLILRDRIQLLASMYVHPALSLSQV